MNTPRTDEKDKSLRGNFAMCYGVMLEFARELERELASSESIRHAEKDILIQEIKAHAETRAERDAMRAEIEAMKLNDTIPEVALKDGEIVCRRCPNAPVVGRERSERTHQQEVRQ